MPSARPDDGEPHPLNSEAAAFFIARLGRDLRGLLGADWRAESRLGVAVSGGPDSMALLALMAGAFPGRVEAITVDHQLRAEAADEAAMVAEWCAGRGIPHAILTPDTPITGSVQAAARAVRYALIEGWRAGRGIDWVATAHHADDQAETLMMRLNRASGVAGLAGVRARNGAIIRPVLGWRRAELAEVVRLLALPHVTDPSNADPRFDRVAMRGQLAQADWIDPAALARSAAALADAEEAIGWSVDALAGAYLHEEAGAWVLDQTDLPRELLRRMLLTMIARAGGDPAQVRGETLDQALVQLFMGKKASIGHWLIEGGARWTLRPAPPRRQPPQ